MANIGQPGQRYFSVLLNNGDWQTTPPLPPAPISIGDTTVTEGDSGTLNATFAVSIAYPNAVDVTVRYETTNYTAFPTLDFNSKSGTLTIPAGQTSRTIAVPIIGDLIAEPTETFTVNLSNSTGATILDAQAVGTIIDNDVTPVIAIGIVSRAEGNSGTTPFRFTVSLASPAPADVQVNYATGNGSASSSGFNRDYQSKSGTLTIPAGVTSQTVTVSVYGDKRNEPNETFYVNLSPPVNATIADSQCQGTILNDDGGRVLRTAGLFLDEGTTLDLSDNALLLDYPSGADTSFIRDQLLSGRNGGAWTGPGISSSTAAANLDSALGYAEATDLFTSFPASFAGQSVDDTSILVPFTRYGDCNLDRNVGIADFAALAANFNAPSTGWSRGNFNYDSAADIADFSLLARNFNLTERPALGTIASRSITSSPFSLTRFRSAAGEIFDF